ncbi:Smr/MutS family protein [Sphingobium sp. YBL2]|uniref:Smr/MutS family protein n=1 Tax=Sphingobium sp. (strain YBL2) TaxID=484429 RepID=UPI0005CC74F6|nr:Smr/MutS family protein [Sphingobium sp. YBL2]AJR24592.1 DNA mismatch repair protein MutS [Sphingobium sp. YBL2]
MPRRGLTSDEQALWTALTRSVRPLRPGARISSLPTPPTPAKDGTGLTAPSVQAVATAPAHTPAATLDSGWERRIRSGNLTPDMTIDLHGHSLSAAHSRLNQALASAWARDVRILLVVTGKPPKSPSASGGSRRGAIRGEIGHWLETSSYADRIASVRIAHRRHGGDGALYVILRRKK